MVRKWSYLGVTSNLSFGSTPGVIEKRYVFKVFRETTRFKKYILFPTVFKRKQDSIRKRKSNWFTTAAVLRVWAIGYAKYRQLIRFDQNINLYNVTAFTPSIGTVRKRVFGADKTPFTSSALSQRLLGYIGQRLGCLHPQINAFPGSHYTTVQTHPDELLSLVDSTLPSTLQWGRALYPLEGNSRSVLGVQPYRASTSQFSNQTINLLTSIYAVHTLLVLKYL